MGVVIVALKVDMIMISWEVFCLGNDIRQKRNSNSVWRVIGYVYMKLATLKR